MKDILNLAFGNFNYSYSTIVGDKPNDITVVLPRRIPNIEDKSVLQIADQIIITLFVKIKSSELPNIEVIGKNKETNIQLSNNINLELNTTTIIKFTTINGGLDWFVCSNYYPGDDAVTYVNGIPGPIIVLDTNDIYLDGSEGTTIKDKFNQIDNLLVGIYHIRGSVESFNDLPKNAAIGDVYNIKTAGGEDIHGQNIKAGDNVVYVDAYNEDPAGWDVLSGVVDLSAYYTSKQIDNILKEYAKDTDYHHTDNNYTTADKTKVSKIITSGDGTKFLGDDGNYHTLDIAMLSE